MSNLSIGYRSGSLVIIGPYNQGHEDKRVKRLRWNCQCDCGKVVDVADSLLKINETKSCGCSKLAGSYGEISKYYFNRLKRKAAQRNLEFEIKIEDMWHLFLAQNRKCAISGVLLRLKLHTNEDWGTASLDRIDSSTGYIVSNIQWIHKDLNKMKMNMSEPEFFNWIDIIHAHRNKSKLNLNL